MEQEGQTARRFFGEHAREYAVNPSFAGGPDLAALTGMLNLSRDERVLDVGTGTGFTALALAPLAKSVVGVDITDEMLEEARSLAKARGARNVRFERGSAMDLKFAGSTFDIVVARRAAHHFDARRFISEARRVLTPSGRLGIIDMSPPDGVQRFVNKIEKLRDESHVRAYSPKEWGVLLTAGGFTITSETVLQETLPFEKWLYPVSMGGPEERAIRSTWSRAPRSTRRLLRAKFADRRVTAWSKSRIIIIASPKTP